MRKIYILLLLLLFYNRLQATVYNIGAGQTYTSLNAFHAAVGWHNLVAGDEVRIHYQTTPYREFMFISSKGTASQHIKIVGVPGPNGEKPVIDGENAIQPSAGFRYQDFNNFLVQTDGILDLPNGNSEPDPQDPNIYTYYGGGLYHLGLIIIGRPSSSDWLDSPEYIDIENLEIRNARQNYQFKPHFSGQVSSVNPYASVYNQPWQSFPSFTAGIWVQRCQNIEIRNCYIHDCGNGIFINSQAYDNGAAGVSNLISKNVLIEKNDIQNNGCGGAYSCHNIYSEASQTTYQYNRIGKKYAGSKESNCIKDRGAGTVVRYNWFDATEQAHILDLVEAEASSSIMIHEPNYHDAYVYGNIFMNPPTGPTTPFHYSGDHQNYALYRQGTLHFWNNTFVNTSDQTGNINAKYRMSLFLFPTSENTGSTVMTETLDAQNNIILNKTETVGAAKTDFYLVTSDGSATYNYNNNWISGGYMNGFSGKWDYVNSVYAPFIGSTNHINTINNSQNDPGFVNISSENLHLSPSAQVIDAGIARNEVDKVYIKDLNFGIRTNINIIDLGAYEYVSAANCPDPTHNIPDGTATICAGESVDLTSKITSYATYLSPVWTVATAGGTSVATPTAVKPTVTTTYVLVAQNALGCKDTANVVITVNAKPNAGTDQSLVCANATTNTLTTTTTLTPNPTGGTWLQIGTSPATASIVANAVSAMSVAGTYQFEYSLNGCKDTVAVSVQLCAVCVKPNAGADAAAVCQPITTAKLTAVTTGGTWSGQSVNPPTANIDVNGNITGLSTAGTYKFVYSVTGGGVTCTDTAQVMVNAKPIIPDGTVTICAGESVDLTTKITSYVTYLSPVWTEATAVGTSVATPTAVKPTATTTYVLVAQNALGCKDTANVVVTVNAKPVITDGTATICAGESVDLTSKITSYVTYLSPVWTEATAVGTSVATPTAVKPTATTTYVLVAQNALGCKDTANVVVTVNAKPVITDGTATICAGESVDLTTKITSYVTYLSPVWTEVTAGGASVSTPTAVKPTATTKYVLVAQNALGCKDTANVVVTVNTKPVITDGTATICAGGSIDLTTKITSYATYLSPVWTEATAGGASVSTPTAVKPTATTTYVLVAQNALGCKDTANVVVTVNAKPVITDGTATICAGESVDLTSKITSYATYLSPVWTEATAGGASVSTPTAVKPTATTTYVLVAQNALGCKDTANVVVTVNAKPNAGTDQTLACANAGTNTLTTSTTLTPNPTGGTWLQIGTSPATASITANAVSGMSVAGTYQFEYSLNGCKDIVVINVQPCTGCVKPNAGADAAAICQPITTAKLTAVTTGGTWSAQTGNPATANIDNNGNITGLSTAGTYKFIYSVTGGGVTCTDTAQVTVNTKPVITDGTATICAGGSIDLTTKITSYATYLSPVWTEATAGGASVSTPTAVKPTVTTTYVLVAQNALGCKDTANVVVTVNAKPNAGTDQTLACANAGTNTLTTSTTLTPNPTGGMWLQIGTSPATASITANAVSGMSVAGTYQFEYSLNGCRDTVAVTVSPCSGCVKPNAGVDQTLICSVAGIAPSSATLAPITSGGIWTAQTGNPATTTINTNAISGMTVSGIYKFIYSVTSGGQICTDTVQILVPTCIIPKGSLGDFVWKDANNNGIQDETTANAGGVANVIVELYKNGTLFNKDTTDATGKYLFSNLDAGTYKIKIVSTTLPVGCEISSNPNAGTDDAKDSDVDKTTGFSGDYVINPIDPTKKDILTVDAGLSNICVQSPQTVFSTCVDNVQLPAPKAGQVWSVVSGNPSNAIINQSGMVTGMTALGIYHFTLSNTNGTCSETFDVTHSDCTKKYDLSLKKKVNNKLPQLNEVINYTIVVKNEGEGTATGVEVSDTLPSGLQYQSFNVVRGTGVYSPTTSVWNLGTLVPGDSAILTISVKVMAQGVMFNKAEISKMNEKDIDSTPGNNNENEDDLGRVCISVPLNICQGEQVQVTIPATFQNVQWFKTVGATTVFVQTGNTISISTSGTYTYLASNGNCPAEGCCPVIVIVGDCCKPNVCIPFNILKIKGKK